MSEFRRDPLTREWVIMAPHRASRPSDIPDDGTTVCPFCPGNEHLTPAEVLAYREPGSAPNRPGWWVRAFPNRYPALAADIDREAARAIGMYDVQSATGRHEVIVEATEHHADFATMSHAQLAEVFWAYRDRIRALSSDPQCAYVALFRNHGELAGATLAHPHTQIIAPSIVPARIAAQATHALNYFEFRGRCGWCDVLSQEIHNEARVVVANERFVAYAPFASRLPYELAIVPFVHASAPAALDRPAIESLAAITGELCARLRAALGQQFAYNMILRMAPRWKTPLEAAFHWHIELLPRLIAAPAGFEFSSGMYINAVAPEAAAHTLRGLRTDARV